MIVTFAVVGLVGIASTAGELQEWGRFLLVRPEFTAGQCQIENAHKSGEYLLTLLPGICFFPEHASETHRAGFWHLFSPSSGRHKVDGVGGRGLAPVRKGSNYTDLVLHLGGGALQGFTTYMLHLYRQLCTTFHKW